MQGCSIDYASWNSEIALKRISDTKEANRSCE